MQISPPPDAPPLWKRRVIFTAMLLLAIALFFSYARRPGDFIGYVAAGNAVLSGNDIYDDTPPGLNNWPPFFSLLCVPLALMDRATPYLARGFWIILNYGVLLLILDMVSRLVYGRKLTFSGANSTVSLASSAILIPLALTLPYLLYQFLYHQVNLILFVLALGGLVLQEKGWGSLGGLALGLAAAMKVMPVLFVPYLAYRRRWKPALSALAATVVFSLTPILVLGWNHFWRDFKAWLAICRRNPWGTGSANQSVYAMWDRFLGHGLVPFVSLGKFFLPMSGDRRVRIAWMLSIAFTGLVVLLAFRGQPRLGSMSSHTEWSVVFLIAALFGPVGWKHYLVVLLLPNALLYAVWCSKLVDARVRKVVGVVLLVAVLLSLSTSHDIVGKSLAQRFETGAVITDAALILLAGLLWFRRQLSVEAISPV
jgi:hypothetical protein